MYKKIMLIAIIMSLIAVSSISLGTIGGADSGVFSITKVNCIEKQWIVPLDRRNFLGSRGIKKFDYARPVDFNRRGEHYVISWCRKGSMLTEPVNVKFEYRTIKDPEELYVREDKGEDFKKKSGSYIFRNIGVDFRKKEWLVDGR